MPVIGWKPSQLKDPKIQRYQILMKNLTSLSFSLLKEPNIVQNPTPQFHELKAKKINSLSLFKIKLSRLKN
jgi:hypothetical protein